MNDEHPKATDDDPYGWLEDLTGDTAMAWVRERNAETIESLARRPRFTSLRDEILGVLDSAERIPSVRRRGDHLYNFWRDAANPRGLWRRTTLDEYRTDHPDWEILLDVDALAAREGANWVWQGAIVRRPDHDRALLLLSDGGADARVVREFDMDSREFLADGFFLPEAKSTVGWIDLDELYVGTDFGQDSLTSSGYPRVIKRWRRGSALSTAATVYEGKPDDVSVGAFHDPTEGFERDLFFRNIDFYRSETHLLSPAGELVKVDVPDDADVDVHREWLLVSTKSPWPLGERTYPAGALLAIGFDDFLHGEREFTVLFEPDQRTSLRYHTWTRHHLIVATLRDVRSTVQVRTPGPGDWRRTSLPEIPEHSTVTVVGADPDHSDEYFVDISGFLEPTTLRRGHIGGPVDTLKRQPAFFDATGIGVRQFFATSADGTAVPYFVVGKDDPIDRPTLLTGYGGFEVSLLPGYSGTIGRGWLARGGTYVVANIRGGGEYGPRWHRAAMRADRSRAYEDFAAVARDLTDRGISSPARLGIQGGSNGGLLTGVMLTRHPELFGAVVSQVPLLDMKRYHRLLAGASWMAEYGDPDDDADWAFIAEYSPYHNVRADLSYPPVLLVTSTRDDRVHPGHARKMAARLRKAGHDVRYYENIEGGHGAAADNDQLAFKSALMYEFLWEVLAKG